MGFPQHFYKNFQENTWGKQTTIIAKNIEIWNSFGFFAIIVVCFPQVFSWKFKKNTGGNS